VGDDESARDIFQDVWVRVIRGIPQLRDGSKLRAWLFGITRRTVMDRLALAVGYATSSRSAIAAAALGVLMLLIATAMLVRAGRDVERLSKRREELERQLGRRLQ
jgi:RNA polymerase sigma-70 factor (ECF subfamily)